MGRDTPGRLLSLCVVVVRSAHRGRWVGTSVYIRNGVTDLGCDLELVYNVRTRYYLGGGDLVSTTNSSVAVVYQVYVYVRCKMCCVNLM